MTATTTGVLLAGVGDGGGATGRQRVAKGHELACAQQRGRPTTPTTTAAAATTAATAHTPCALLPALTTGTAPWHASGHGAAGWPALQA